jgi:hypothetical protein
MEVKYLYSASYKTLKKELKEDTRRWEDLPCSSISRINTMKMAIVSRPIYIFHALTIQIAMIFVTEVENNQS